jgi:hypothetical protein
MGGVVGELGEDAVDRKNQNKIKTKNQKKYIVLKICIFVGDKIANSVLIGY